MRRKRRRSTSRLSTKAGFDRSLTILAIALTILGIIAVADASSPQALRVFGDPYYFVKQQVMWGVLGLAGMMVASLMPYPIWRKTAWVVFGVSAVLLIAVLVPGVGAKVLGARRWISLGPVRFQPSEVVKLTTILFTAYLIDSGKPLWLMVTTMVSVAGLIMMQPDLGTTIVVVGIVMTMLFVGGMKFRYFIGVMMAGSVAGAGAILFSNYRKERLISFLESTIDPLGSSYHIRQVLIALGSGGLLGVGLGQSRQKHLFLPETATDSVFAIIGEEVGFLGASVVVVLLVVFTLRALRIAAGAPDRFSQITAVGIATWIGGQTFLNIASMVALTPLTGIPMPFFSYGGSSLTMLLVSVGILLNISKYANE